ncbi:MAG: transposase [Bacteroidota bacterium]
MQGQKKIEGRGYPSVRAICFDEITLYKGYGKFVLVISAPELGLVLDILEDRSQETLLNWLEKRGPEWCAAVKVACSDMWDAYQEAAAQKLPNARRVVDRFHGDRAGRGAERNGNDGSSKCGRRNVVSCRLKQRRLQTRQMYV